MSGRQPHDAVRTADGTIVVTNERGGGVVFVRDGAVDRIASRRALRSRAGPPWSGEYAAVADVQGNGVWVYDGSSRREVAQKRVGTKLTHADRDCRTISPPSRTPTAAPFSSSASIRRSPKSRESRRPENRTDSPTTHSARRLYVTLTATNQLQVVDLADPASPRIIGVVPTVQQPNSVAVEPRSGAVLVTGSKPAGALQIVTPDLLPKG